MPSANAVAHLERVRWGGTPRCPYCDAERVSRHRERGRDDRWQCRGCLKSFSVTVGTIFHRSHVDLKKWFRLISMMRVQKSLSAAQAARDLEMRMPTVWSMMRRIRGALAGGDRLLQRL